MHDGLYAERSFATLDFGDYLSLVLLDSGHVAPIGGEQADWLDSALGERAERPHVFAVNHVPGGWTSGARNVRHTIIWIYPMTLLLTSELISRRNRARSRTTAIAPIMRVAARPCLPPPAPLHCPNGS